MGIVSRRLRPLFVIALLLGSASGLLAQRRVRADVEVKSVAQGKSVTVTKSVYCLGNGRMVVHFHTPQDYYIVTNVLGETRLYMPGPNEVLTDNSGGISSKDELLSIFLSGRVEDLALGLYGYRLLGAASEDGLVKRTYVNSDDSVSPKVEVVSKDYLPIYAAYYKPDGSVSSKTYFSKYAPVGRAMFPMRVTSIAYVGRDSTVTRTLYSGVQFDSEDPDFDFEVPADAKVSALPKMPAQ